MRGVELLYSSIILLILGLSLAFLSIEAQKIELVNYNVSNVAYPPQGWYNEYWSVFVYGKT